MLERRPGPGRALGFVVRWGMAIRTAFHESLDHLWIQMAQIAQLDAVAIERASQALLEADGRLAQSVIGEQAHIPALAEDLETRATELIALQQPVAGDLRLVLSTFPISAALARMGGLAQHVARTAHMRAPEHAVVSEMRPVFAGMSRAAIRAATDLTTALQERDGDRGLALEIADDVMDGLHAQLLLQARVPTWPHGVGPAVDAALLGRFYERFADQAVGIGRRIHFIRTGRQGPTRKGCAPFTAPRSEVDGPRPFRVAESPALNDACSPRG